MSDRMREFLKLHVGYVVVAIACGMYVATSFLDFHKSGDSVFIILVNGFLAFILGISINRILTTVGITNGAREPEVLTAEEKHAAAVEAVAEEMEELDEWCTVQNRKNYRIQRIKILSSAGLYIRECFTEDGVALPYEPKIVPWKSILTWGPRLWYIRRRDAKSKLKAYVKAVTLRLTEINSGLLTSEGGRGDDLYGMGRSVAEYMSQTAWKDVASKICTAVIFGYYTADFLAGMNAGVLMWRLLQVVFFLLVGVMKMQGSHSFMVTEYKDRKNKKTSILRKFLGNRYAPMARKDEKYEFDRSETAEEGDGSRGDTSAEAHDGGDQAVGVFAVQGGNA